MAAVVAAVRAGPGQGCPPHNHTNHPSGRPAVGWVMRKCVGWMGDRLGG